MTQMFFISLEDYKEKVGITDKIDIQHNPASGKIFGTHSKGTTKVQQDLNPALPIRYMYEEGNFQDGCIVNVKPLETRFSL